MDIIEKFLKRATVSETCDLVTNAAAILVKFPVGNNYLARLGSKLSATSGAMLSAIGADRTHDYTNELSTGDYHRDSRLGAFKLFLRAYLRWQNPEYAAAADRLMHIVRNHGLDIERESYAVENAKLGALINDLEVAKADIDLLWLTALFADLKASQEAFVALYQKSIATEAGKETGVAAYQLRIEALNTCDELVDYLNAMVKAEPESYQSLCKEMAQLINTANTKVRTRTKIEETKE